MTEDEIAKLLDAVSDGWWEWQIADGKANYSEMFQRWYDKQDAPLAPTMSAWLKQVHVDDRKHAQAVLASHLESGYPYQTCLRFIDSQGDIAWMLCRGLAVKDNHDKIHLIGTQTDITPYKKLEAQLQASQQTLQKFRQTLAKQQHLLTSVALKDPTTKLLNRQGFAEAATRYLAESARYQRFLPTFLLNLDGFKNVNDSLGHAAGDILLQKVAKRLLKSTRQEDIVARLGSDEFALILSNTKSPYDTAMIAERIVASLAQPYELNDTMIQISASVGIACTPEVNPDLTDVLKYSARAMQQAKSYGRNTYRFYSMDMNDVYQERAYIVRALHNAIKNNEFHLVYQPQVELKHCTTVGVEALLRWNHPEHGTIRPDIFIGIAEEIGLMNTIGEWVIHQACSDLHSWEGKLKRPISMAINLSAQQLMSESLVYNLHRTLKKFNLNPHQIELELTETAVMQNSVEAIDTLNQIHDLGVRISIDDFGTGYSSLQRIKKLPISALKIDRSFIHDLTKDENNAIIAQSIVDLGKNLDLDVIAEGIENENELAFLQGCHCPQGQGYFFSKPLVYDKILDYIANH